MNRMSEQRLTQYLERLMLSDPVLLRQLAVIRVLNEFEVGAHVAPLNLGWFTTGSVLLQSFCLLTLQQLDLLVIPA